MSQLSRPFAGALPTQFGEWNTKRNEKRNQNWIRTETAEIEKRLLFILREKLIQKMEINITFTLFNRSSVYERTHIQMYLELYCVCSTTPNCWTEIFFEMAGWLTGWLTVCLVSVMCFTERKHTSGNGKKREKNSTKTEKETPTVALCGIVSSWFSYVHAVHAVANTSTMFKWIKLASQEQPIRISTQNDGNNKWKYPNE